MSKSSKNRVLTAGIGYIIGGMLIKGIAFITTPIFSRLLTPAEFGVLNTFLSYEAILAMIIGFQFAASLKSAKLEFASSEKGVSAYFSNVLVLIVVHTVIIFALVNAFAEPIMKFTGISSVMLLNMLVLNSFGVAIVNVYNSYASLNYEYKKYVIIGLINALCNVVLSLILIKTFMSGDKSTGRILGYVIPYAIIGVYLLIYAFSKSFPKLGSNSGMKRFAYGYCSPLIPYGFSEVMLGQYGKLTVDRNFGDSVMGVYSLSYNVYSIIGIIRIAMDYIVGPFYFDKKSKGEIKQIQNIIKVYSRLLAFIAILLMLFSPEIIRILGSAEYYEARISAIPLVAGSYFVFLCSTVNQEEYYLKKTYWVSIVSVVTMAVNILACSLVIPRFGALGAAFCAMCAYLFMLLLHFAVIVFVLRSKAFNWINIFIDVIVVSVTSLIAICIVDMLIVRLCVILLVGICFVLYALKAFKTFKENKT